MANSALSSKHQESEDVAESLFSRINSYIFSSCDEDPKASVQKTWAFAMMVMFMLFCIACVTASSFDKTYGSRALTLAAAWTAVVQVVVSIMGTFILRRFPTSFSIGFFLGMILVLASQNIIIFATFHDFSTEYMNSNSRIFADVALLLGIVYIAFGAILAQFRDYVIMAPNKAKTMRNVKVDNDHHTFTSFDESETTGGDSRDGGLY
mmetsp:Transcript_41331/g.48226  ORF Transcript_41331/g.48226 Transcript_41331/m.48226 type:complete len:208 (-) Transcript_41331:117-740(-)|eukprot:CAMPEP_0194356258 /NCGR_PEP_ID=MMETSP0174-20130528/3971_1 /TAXON_ID=216777 /ORGANISM="Proboscia alata, Strain PI-D3" /LENGTH=207 /DNA_ID=CAMNT_0039125793 /DNA_START=36 /DNA_END=659 /DNA_ORIENTATION=-